jgi:hypothetical protein
MIRAKVNTIHKTIHHILIRKTFIKTNNSVFKIDCAQTLIKPPVNFLISIYVTSVSLGTK